MKSPIFLLAVAASTAATAAACSGGQRASVSPRANVHVESMRLTRRIPTRVRSTCAQARREVRIAVVCPPLVPVGGVVADPNLYGAETMDPAGDFYLLTFNNGDNRGYTHWIVGAGRHRTVHRYVLDPRFWEVPGHIRRLGKRRYGRWAITFYGYPPHPSGGPFGGHVLALTRMGGTTYFASVHGTTHRDADAAMLLAILLTAGHR
jgi:hypothetical protein